jgi:radical SAM protein with 4Fe4S-binding SPASM domain
MKRSSSQEFRRRLHSVARTRAFPLRVMYELTYRCNFKCPHCYVPFRYRKKRELPTRQVFSILNQLSDIGCFYLGFTGGEPFMRSDMLDILRYARKRGFQIIIYTNGSLIDKITAKELGRIRPNKVDITIPAMTKDVFERITNAPGSHEKVFNAIDLLKREGVALGFKTCVLKENQGQISSIRDFACSSGAAHRLDDMLSPRLDGSRAPFEYRSRPAVRAQEYNGKRKPESGVFSRSSSQECGGTPGGTLFSCGAGSSQAAITPSGQIKACVMIDHPRYRIIETAGEKHRADLSTGWDRLKKFFGSVKADENYRCGACELKNYCKWCPAKGWLYERNFTACEPESRRGAELARRSLSSQAVKLKER